MAAPQCMYCTVALFQSVLQFHLTVLSSVLPGERFLDIYEKMCVVFPLMHLVYPDELLLVNLLPCITICCDRIIGGGDAAHCSFSEKLQ